MFFPKIVDDQDQQLELMQDGYRSPIPEELRWRAWASDPEGITGDELLIFISTQLFPALKGLSAAGKQGDSRRVIRDVFEDAYNYMKSGQLMRQVINKIDEVDFTRLLEAVLYHPLNSGDPITPQRPEDSGCGVGQILVTDEQSPPAEEQCSCEL